MAFEFRLPDIGEGIHEGEIVQWLVSEGDVVKEDQPLVEVMTDKVTAEIPSPVSGTVTALNGKVGEIVKVGSVIVVMETEGAAPAKASAKAAEKAEVKADVPARTTAAVGALHPAATNGNGVHKQAVTSAPEQPARVGEKVLAAPATRKLARQMGVDLQMIAGSGPRGRVTPDDVRRWQGRHGMAGSPAPGTPVQAGEYRSRGERREPFAGMRRKIAEHLVKSKQTAPHFAYVEEVEMTNVVAMRNQLMSAAAEQDVKLSYLPFVIKAVIAGLKKYPVLNSQLDENSNEVVYKNDFHMGVAVATEQGLIVPVVKYADQKDLFTLAREIKDLATRARGNKLKLDEIQGGTFTITSIGSIGGLFGIPIINYPEVGIMGVNKIEQRAVVRDGEIVARDMMNLSLSCDHRVVDGAEGALFIKEVIRYLENPALFLVNT